MELVFDADLTGLPGPGEIQIRELLAGGAFGSDISGEFTFSIPGAANVLLIEENGDGTLDHGMWVGVINAGYAAATPFQLDRQVAIGDATADSRVLSIDVSSMNAEIPCFTGCTPRLDINGDGRVLSIDVSITNGFIPSFGTTKPDGHGCLP
jgi:hypothetical protein